MRAIMDGMVQMSSVNVDRVNLLATIKNNRVKHVEAYQQAVKDYREVASALVIQEVEKAAAALQVARGHLLDRITKLSESDIEDLMQQQVHILNGVSFHLPVPQNHVKDYDAVISMLEMSVDTNISLAADQHACFVLDDWDWKKDFQHSNRVYETNKMRLGIR